MFYCRCCCWCFWPFLFTLLPPYLDMRYIVAIAFVVAFINFSHCLHAHTLTDTSLFAFHMHTCFVSDRKTRKSISNSSNEQNILKIY